MVRYIYRQTDREIEIERDRERVNESAKKQIERIMDIYS
jgi:hypothetical protein